MQDRNETNQFSPKLYRNETKGTGLVQNLTGTKQSEQIRPKPGKIDPNIIEVKRANLLKTLWDPGHEIVCRGRKSACRGRESHCRVGGFNVSNLMGITRRKIDIGKKITFYFLQNVWKCTVFFAFAFKVCKKCYYDPKKFFLKNIIMGIKKTQNFMLISNSLMPT